MAKRYFTLVMVVLLFAALAFGQDDPQPSQGGTPPDAPPMGSQTPIQSPFWNQFPDSGGAGLPAFAEADLFFNANDGGSSGCGPSGEDFVGGGIFVGRDTVAVAGSSWGSHFGGGWSGGVGYIGSQANALNSAERWAYDSVMPLVLMASGGRGSLARMRTTVLTDVDSYMTYSDLHGNHLMDWLERTEQGGGALGKIAGKALDKFEEGKLYIQEIIRGNAALKDAILKYADALDRGEGPFLDQYNGEKFRTGIVDEMTPEHYEEYGLRFGKTSGYAKRLRPGGWYKRTGD